MARNRKSGLESLIRLVSLLPPWAGFALAVLSYLILRALSLQEIPTSSGIEGASAVLFATLIQQSARFAQYFVPLLLIIGAIASFAKRSKRKALAAQTIGRGKVSALLDMSWQEFEMLVSEAYRKQGYQVTENSRAGPDGGVDLVLTKGSESFLVQCKQWRAQKVGVEIVRELYGLMAARGATGGYVVTAGSFTLDALAFADGRNIFLVDGQQLINRLARKPQAIHFSTQTSPLCPVCNATMMYRKARKGKNTGKVFWGCSSFPNCRGTRRVTGATP